MALLPVAAGLLALLLVETSPPDAGDAPPALPPAQTAVEPPSTPPPEAPPPPPPAPGVVEEPPPPRMYGDRGSVELGLGFGYQTQSGFVGAGGFRYFVVDRLAPGIEGTYVSGGSSANGYGLLLASLRLAALRTNAFAIVVTGRAGRVMLGNHDDGWGAGGSAGVLFLFTPTVGLELGYEALWLYPASFCADLEDCVIHGPVIALRFGF